MVRGIASIYVALCLGGAAAGQDAHGFGPVEPVDLPDVMATRHDGVRVKLRQALEGRRTAVQFVFVDCTTACPLLGSLFRKIDKALGTTDAQLVSITVNPERDTPQRLAEWLRKFQASSRWVGLRIDAADLPRLLRAFKQETGPPSGHTLQVFLVDGKARYVARTISLPSAAALAEELRLGSNWPTEPEPVLTRGFIGMLGPDRLEPIASRCGGCHGAEWRGGGEGTTVVPALTKESLTTLRARRGGPPSGYTQRSFCDALRRGVDPVGVRFSDIMPRYRLDGRACHQLWEFLTDVK